MLRRIIVLLLGLVLLGTSTPAQAQKDRQSQSGVILIKAGRLLDVKWGTVLTNQGVLVEKGRIKRVGPFEDVARRAPKNALVIDLSNATVLPGLIDCHTHLLLSSDGRQDTTLKMSQAEREALAARMARETLEDGITTVR